jgi:hypothetical protein
VVEGPIKSEEEADKVESILRNGDIDTDISMVLYGSGGPRERAIFRGEADEAKSSCN